MRSKIINSILFIAALGIFVYAFFIYDSKKPIRYLPIFGEKSYESINGKTDTVYHTVKDFSFTDQDGKTITQNDLKGCVYVTDFFFTTCHSICPIMSTHMEKVAEKFKG